MQLPTLTWLGLLTAAIYLVAVQNMRPSPTGLRGHIDGDTMPLEQAPPNASLSLADVRMLDTMHAWQTPPSMRHWVPRSPDVRVSAVRWVNYSHGLDGCVRRSGYPFRHTPPFATTASGHVQVGALFVPNTICQHFWACVEPPTYDARWGLTPLRGREDVPGFLGLYCICTTGTPWRVNQLPLTTDSVQPYLVPAAACADPCANVSAYDAAGVPFAVDVRDLHPTTYAQVAWEAHGLEIPASVDNITGINVVIEVFFGDIPDSGFAMLGVAGMGEVLTPTPAALGLRAMHNLQLPRIPTLINMYSNTYRHFEFSIDFEGDPDIRDAFIGAPIADVVFEAYTDVNATILSMTAHACTATCACSSTVFRAVRANLTTPCDLVETAVQYAVDNVFGTDEYGLYLYVNATGVGGGARRRRDLSLFNVDIPNLAAQTLALKLIFDPASCPASAALLRVGNIPVDGGADICKQNGHLLLIRDIQARAAGFSFTNLPLLTFSHRVVLKQVFVQQSEFAELCSEAPGNHAILRMVPIPHAARNTWTAQAALLGTIAFAWYKCGRFCPENAIQLVQVGTYPTIVVVCSEVGSTAECFGASQMWDVPVLDVLRGTAAATVTYTNAVCKDAVPCGASVSSVFWYACTTTTLCDVFSYAGEVLCEAWTATRTDATTATDAAAACPAEASVTTLVVKPLTAPGKEGQLADLPDEKILGIELVVEWQSSTVNTFAVTGFTVASDDKPVLSASFLPKVSPVENGIPVQIVNDAAYGRNVTVTLRGVFLHAARPSGIVVTWRACTAVCRCQGRVLQNATDSPCTGWNTGLVLSGVRTDRDEHDTGNDDLHTRYGIYSYLVDNELDVNPATLPYIEFRMAGTLPQNIAAVQTMCRERGLIPTVAEHEKIDYRANSSYYYSARFATFLLQRIFSAYAPPKSVFGKYSNEIRETDLIHSSANCYTAANVKNLMYHIGYMRHPMFALTQHAMFMPTSPKYYTANDAGVFQLLLPTQDCSAYNLTQTIVFVTEFSSNDNSKPLNPATWAFDYRFSTAHPAQNSMSASAFPSFDFIGAGCKQTPPADYTLQRYLKGNTTVVAPAA